jgi:hypothetical protein
MFCSFLSYTNREQFKYDEKRAKQPARAFQTNRRHPARTDGQISSHLQSDAFRFRQNLRINIIIGIC